MVIFSSWFHSDEAVLWAYNCRHQLVPDEELGSLYDLLIDEPAEIRRAIGALVYDHLIAQKFNSSQPRSSGLPKICAPYYSPILSS